MLSFTDAFQKSCQQQICVNAIHYSVITNCGLHKSACYFAEVQRNMVVNSKVREACKKRKDVSLGQTKDALERSHLSTDLERFWGSPRGADGMLEPPC